MYQDSNPFKDCNLLWKVGVFPTYDKYGNCRQHLFDSTAIGPAHLLLVDEQDGYRLTWIYNAAMELYNLDRRPLHKLWRTETGAGKKRKETVRSTNKTHIVSPIARMDAGWVRCSHHEHRLVEHMDDEENCARKQLGIAFSAFFSATALLHDILSRRPGLVQPRFDASSAKVPNYSYYLVGIYECGRTAEILIVFSVGPAGKGCVGVYVEIDLFTSDYQEKEFIRNCNSDTPPSMCAGLALERRRLEILGQTAADETTRTASMLPELYPDCETIDNVAVRRQRPIWSMKAGDAPVEIVYG
jgi:hypothetical protein